MKQYLASLILALGCCTGVIAQTPSLPAGYRLAEGQEAIRYDFDRDGRPDLFCAAEKEGEEARLIGVLKGGGLVRMSGPLAICCGSLSQRNGIIDVHSKGMRGFSYYKFRWDAVAGDFRLIGYDTESFGNAVNDGSGRSSINLLTGAYEAVYNSWNSRTHKLVALPQVKRKISVSRKLYLRSFTEDTDEWLAELNAKYLPPAVR